jgi:DNA-binding transcriptional LysR family regulator
MEVHQLRYFLAIAQTGSFTAAAFACNVSQPSLSAQVAKLEAELGGLLFDRSHQGARLTARGALFHSRAAEALRQLEIGRLELEELAGLRRGSVDLGCLPTTGAYLLPPLLKAFRQSYPEIQVNLREGSSPMLAQALRESKVDLVLMDEAGVGPGLEVQVLFSEPLLVALPPGHPLSTQPRIKLSQLALEPFILMKSGHGFRKIVIDALQNSGITPQIVYESDEIGTVQALVEAGLGISLVPRMVCKSPGPTYRELEAPTPSRTLLLAFREASTASPAAQALRNTALSVFANGLEPPLPHS